MICSKPMIRAMFNHAFRSYKISQEFETTKHMPLKIFVDFVFQTCLNSKFRILSDYNVIDSGCFAEYFTTKES